jgi:hypothetical protein
MTGDTIFLIDDKIAPPNRIQDPKSYYNAYCLSEKYRSVIACPSVWYRSLTDTSRILLESKINPIRYFTFFTNSHRWYWVLYTYVGGPRNQKEIEQNSSAHVNPAA